MERIRTNIEFQTLMLTSKVRNCPCQAISVTVNSCDRHMSLTLWREKQREETLLSYKCLFVAHFSMADQLITQSDVPANICSLLNIYLSAKGRC